MCVCTWEIKREREREFCILHMIFLNSEHLPCVRVRVKSEACVSSLSAVLCVQLSSCSSSARSSFTFAAVCLCAQGEGVCLWNWKLNVSACFFPVFRVIACFIACLMILHVCWNILEYSSCILTWTMKFILCGKLVQYWFFPPACDLPS